jgi:hypothetical protein
MFEEVSKLSLEEKAVELSQGLRLGSPKAKLVEA